MMHSFLRYAGYAAICLCAGIPRAAHARGWRPAANSAVVAGNVLIILPGRVSTMDDPTWPPPGGSDVAPAPPRDGALASVQHAVQPRGDRMFDFYPRHGRGLRLSVGTRYFQDYDAADSGPGALAGPIATMRLPGGGVALRDGYERYAPVAMIGYGVPLARRLMLGVEGGVMSGRAAAMFGTSWVAGRGAPPRAEGNPVADVTATYRF